jgi:hypothetical protein
MKRHTMCSRRSCKNQLMSAACQALVHLYMIHSHHFGGAQLAVCILQHISHDVVADAVVRAVGQAPLQQKCTSTSQA